MLRENAAYMLRVRLATFYEDTKEGTDMVAEVDGGKIAIRLRRPSCVHRDFTLRSYNRGNLTELDKIKTGRSGLRWYLYGWMDSAGTLSEWALVDMPRLLESNVLNKQRREIPNTDNTTKFVAINLRELREASALIAVRRKLGGYWWFAERVGASTEYDITQTPELAVVVADKAA